MSGQQVIEELKRRGAQVPVILISGQGIPDLIDRATGVQADAFIRKPFELAHLARTVRGVLEAA